ncbi:MAG: protein-PII uridylyltransferase, partial [Deltaproteobacteria bacterium]
DELNELWRALKLGSLDAEGRDKVTDKLIRKIKQAISETSLKHLTANYNSVISWFFAALPNRFLLGTPPGILSANLQMFQRLDRPAIVSVQANARGRLTGLLIYVHDQPRIHSKVAYALSLKRLNIESGKMNRIVFAGEKVAYCYFLKISVRERGEMIFPREMENSILNNPPPELKIQPQDFVYNTRMQLEYLDDDQKGYVISQETSEKFHDFPVWLGNEPETEQFSRIPEENQRVKITVTDAPLVYFKIIYAFERVGIKIQQAVITTIGHQVIDTFYIKPSDLEKLRLSDFEEYLKQSLMSPSEI